MTNYLKDHIKKPDQAIDVVRDEPPKWNYRPFRSKRENAIMALFIFGKEEIEEHGGLTTRQIGYVLDAYDEPRSGGYDWLRRVKVFLKEKGLVDMQARIDTMALKYPSQTMHRHCEKLADKDILKRSENQFLGSKKYLPGKQLLTAPSAWRRTRKELLSFEEEECWSNGVVSLVGISRLKPTGRRIELPEDLQPRMVEDIDLAFRKLRDSWLGNQRGLLEGIRQKTEKRIDEIQHDSLTPWKGKTDSEMWNALLSDFQEINRLVERTKAKEARERWSWIVQEMDNLKGIVDAGKRRESKDRIMHVFQRLVEFKLWHLDLERRIRDSIDMIAREYDTKVPSFPIIVINLNRLNHPLP